VAVSKIRVSVDATDIDGFDLVPTPTAVVGLAGDFQRVNPALCRFLGRPAEDLVGHDVRTVSHPSDAEAFARFLTEARAGRTTQRGTDKRFVLPGGKDVWAEVNTVLLTDPEGRPLCLLTQMFDIDERKHGELTLRAENAHLTQLNGELRAAAERGSDVLAASAHEMRSPLTTIAGMAQTLEQRWPDLTDAARSELLTSLRGQSDRLTELAADLLTLASADAGASVVQARRVEAAPLVAQAVASAGLNAGDVAVDCPPGLLVSADPSRLTQILVNLLSNARRHGAPPISVQVAAHGNAVELCVADQGPGVSPEFAGHLFERFSRASDAARRDPRGTGLGLAIVHELTDAHGGEVWYEPNRPKGSRFCVRLGPPRDRS
jgi:PAS domain S-box-containing protein